MQFPVGVCGAEDFDFVKPKHAFEHHAVYWSGALFVQMVFAHSGMTCMIKGKH